MFFFEGFVVLFSAAAPLAFLLVINRDQYKLPKYILLLAMITLLSATLVLIGLVGVIF